MQRREVDADPDFEALRFVPASDDGRGTMQNVAVNLCDLTAFFSDQNELVRRHELVTALPPDKCLEPNERLILKSQFRLQKDLQIAVGDVVQIKLMETYLKSIKNELVSIPNAHLLNSEVLNYSSMIDGRGLMLHTTVGIGYEEPQEKVEAMLIEAAHRTSGIKKNPSPFVLRKQLADFAVNYEINAFTSRGNKIPQLLSELHSHILDIFHANGVQIMTPSYESDPEQAKIPPENWDGTLADK